MRIPILTSRYLAPTLALVSALTAMPLAAAPDSALPQARPAAPQVKRVPNQSSRLHHGLQSLATTPLARTGDAIHTLRRQFPKLQFGQAKDGTVWVKVDAVARSATDTLATRLRALGARQLASRGRVISAQVPVESLAQLGADRSLAFARPVRAITRRGAVTSQGDHALRAPSIRPPAWAQGPTGSGVKVGVLSDSFDCLGGAQTDETDGEFSPVTVLQELDAPDPENPNNSFPCLDGTDEGRAMIQIVADVAPDSTQLFHSAFNGEAAFANGIEALQAAGADVIVDDVLYLTQPFFHDGIVAQAVDRVVSRGAAYFSAAGNNGRHSYEAPFDGADGALDLFLDGEALGLPGRAHDFAPDPSGTTLRQQVTIPPGSTLTLVLQWDDPFFSSSPDSPGAATDLDIYLADSNRNVVAASAEFNVIPGGPDEASGDAIEILDYTNGTDASQTRFLHIRKFQGPDPLRIKHINFGDPDIAFANANDSGTAVGHPAAKGAFAVGAAAYYESPACGVTPALIEPYSSAGGTPILLQPDGTRLAIPDMRQKPDAVGPDGANTSFFGDDDGSFSTLRACADDDQLGNFFGTSAAAPHIAGVAALLLEVVPNATPARVYKALRDSALDMGDAGIDLDSGHGFIQADRALNRLSPPRVTLSRVSQGVAEGRPAVVDLVLERPPTERAVAFLGVSGTATSGTDYDTLPSRVVFRAGGSSRRRVTARSIDDAIPESNETVIIDVTKVNGGRRGDSMPFTATIRNND